MRTNVFFFAAVAVVVMVVGCLGSDGLFAATGAGGFGGGGGGGGTAGAGIDLGAPCGDASGRIDRGGGCCLGCLDPAWRCVACQGVDGGGDAACAEGETADAGELGCCVCHDTVWSCVPCPGEVPDAGCGSCPIDGGDAEGENQDAGGGLVVLECEAGMCPPGTYENAFTGTPDQCGGTSCAQASEGIQFICVRDGVNLQIDCDQTVACSAGCVLVSTISSCDCAVSGEIYVCLCQ